MQRASGRGNRYQGVQRMGIFIFHISLYIYPHASKRNSIDIPRSGERRASERASGMMTVGRECT